jgi:Zn-dependent M28 family amino/carboxypeptidase
LRVAAVAATAALLCVYAIGPTFLMTNPEARRARLAKLAPALPIRDPKTLSPLAARLRGHVLALAKDIGERDAYQRRLQERARDYVASRLRAAGYAPRLLAYGSEGLSSIKNGTEFYNVEAVLGRAPVDQAGAWIIGAHYDSAPGTPGADDNASGVAVLIETARLMKMSGAPRELRFVAFGTEEPPSFGTRNMGSHRYARALKENGAKVHGMISLEMLGYFNPRPGSQLYPPFLHLVNPDRGDYVGAVGDWRSRALVAGFAAAWRRESRFPLTTAILPGAFSSLAMSDQLNFWDEGYAALMLSDTAFYRNPNYHQENDAPETLDYERMAEVARALAAALR